MRKTHFPDDWIEPGEFSFCGTCSCTESILPMNFALRPKCVFCQGKKTERDIAIGKSIYAMREKLAEVRRSAGWPPLYWKRKDG